jgi:hypothetical protein
MEFIEFVGREFSDEILVEAGDFVVISFEDERHVRIQISAWEIDGEKFDLFLVKENDILEDRFREKGAYFSKTGISDFENEYTFDLRHKRCLVLSNVRAISKDKLIKVHLLRIDPSELTGVQYPIVTPQSKDEQTSQNTSRSLEQSTWSINWLHAGLFFVFLIVIAAVAYLLYFVHPFLGGLVVPITAIVLTIFRQDVRKFLIR